MNPLAALFIIAVAICGGVIALAILAVWAVILEAVRTANEDVNR